MTPTVHFDRKACDSAVEAYTCVADECPNIVKNGALADRLSDARSQLNKKPGEKKPMDVFVACLKEAQANSQLLQTLAGKLHGNHMQAFGGGEARKAAYLLYVKKLQGVLARDMSLVKPPRPMNGPPVPAKH